MKALNKMLKNLLKKCKRKSNSFSKKKKKEKKVNCNTKHMSLNIYLKRGHNSLGKAFDKYFAGIVCLFQTQRTKIRSNTIVEGKKCLTII